MSTLIELIAENRRLKAEVERLTKLYEAARQALGREVGAK